MVVRVQLWMACDNVSEVSLPRLPRAFVPCRHDRPVHSTDGARWTSTRSGRGGRKMMAMTMLLMMMPATNYTELRPLAKTINLAVS